MALLAEVIALFMAAVLLCSLVQLEGLQARLVGLRGQLRCETGVQGGEAGLSAMLPSAAARSATRA